jgi:DNA mismatch endonuclease (patch repair protein)
MSRIHGKNTSPEKAVRSFLHKSGFRFRLHVSNLPGKPDIVLPKYQTAIFVNGCFWHHHSRCKEAVYPKNRKRFWRLKIDGNIQRDKRAARALRKLGWRVVTVWECEIDRANSFGNRIRRLIDNLDE